MLKWKRGKWRALQEDGLMFPSKCGNIVFLEEAERRWTDRVESLKRVDQPVVAE